MEHREESTNPEQKGKSTVVENILSGKAKISYLTDGTDSRTIAGREWLGHSYTYNLTVPHPMNEGENWETTLTVWDALPLNQGSIYVDRPKTQLTILTGQGETPFSKDEEVVHKVLDEISRQVSKPEKEISKE
jgi:hypothetical protein